LSKRRVVITGLGAAPLRRHLSFAVCALGALIVSGLSVAAMAVIGRYVLPGKVFDILGRVTPGVGGEIQLTDALAGLAAGEGLLGCLFEGKRYDAGDKVGYLEANLAWALKHPDMRKGVIELCARYAKEKV
jgi:UTP--glucose-1-phosphate uridylyltransferase